MSARLGECRLTVSVNHGWVSLQQEPCKLGSMRAHDFCKLPNGRAYQLRIKAVGFVWSCVQLDFLVTTVSLGPGFSMGSKVTTDPIWRSFV